jgi:DNA polymerase-4
MERHIVHLDLDAFFVSVERLNNPELRNVPVLVGGHSDRSVVAAASYETRKFGVHSAMPMKLARRLCPEAVIIGSDMQEYTRFSQMVTDVIASKVPVYEKSSIDEFYIDMTGMDRFFGCRKYAAELKQYIYKETGLIISYALASNKLLSKVATNEKKPEAAEYVPYGSEKSYLAPLSIDRMPMIGKKTSDLLFSMGVNTIKVLSEIPKPMLENLMGKNGLELWRRANGIDDSPIVPYRDQKSISTETTFPQDTTDIRFLHAQLTHLAERAAFELRQQNKLAGCITVKIRYADFDTVTRQVSVPYTSLDHIILKQVTDLFNRLYDRRVRIRLVGVKLSRLVPGNYQISLFDDTSEMISLFQSMDYIKKRFGAKYLSRGGAFVEPPASKNKDKQHTKKISIHVSEL